MKVGTTEKMKDFKMTDNTKTSRVRIIKRTKVGGGVKFVIQQKLLWWWHDGVEKHPDLPCFRAYEFDTPAQAKRSICFFDSSKPVEEIVQLENEGLGND